jgi:hypothetical protein
MLRNRDSGYASGPPCREPNHCRDLPSIAKIVGRTDSEETVKRKRAEVFNTTLDSYRACRVAVLCIQHTDGCC